MFKTILAISLLIASISVFYFLVIYLPEKETREEKREVQRIELVELCIQRAKNSYLIRWNSSCADLGLIEKCNLPLKLAQGYESDTNKAIDDCKFYANGNN